MKVVVEDNTVIIDDNKIIVEENVLGYQVFWGNGLNPIAIGNVTYQEPVEYDDHYYINGNNGLTVEESVDKALDKVYHDIWGSLAVGSFGPDDLMLEAVTKLIKDGEGRSKVYELAGHVKKQYQKGNYVGVPLVYLFHALVYGYMEKEKEAVKKHLFHRSGIFG